MAAVAGPGQLLERHEECRLVASVSAKNIGNWHRGAAPPSASCRLAGPDHEAPGRNGRMARAASQSRRSERPCRERPACIFSQPALEGKRRHVADLRARAVPGRRTPCRAGTLHSPLEPVFVMHDRESRCTQRHCDATRRSGIVTARRRLKSRWLCKGSRANFESGRPVDVPTSPPLERDAKKWVPVFRGNPP